MHMHVSLNFMRTTIEMKKKHRAKLLEIAARRGEKGFSHLVSEAIDAYLERIERNDEKLKQALRLRGCLPEESANHMLAEAMQMRESWR